MPKNPNAPLVVTWKVFRNGEYVEVDPFSFAREVFDTPKKLFDKKLLGSIFEQATLKVGRGYTTNVKENIYAINIDLVDSSFFQRTTKGGTTTKSILEEKKLGLQTLKNILSPPELSKLAYRAYIEGKDSVKALLTQYLSEQSAFNIHTRERQSGGPRFEHAAKDESGQITMPTRKNKTFIKKGGTRYGSTWNSLMQDVVLGPPKRISGGVISFGLQDLLATPFQMPRSNTSFTSVFLMEEFGTGLDADEELLRKYTSKGRSQSRFKVPPTIASKFHQPEAVAMWFTSPIEKYRAYLLYAQLLKGKKNREAHIKKALTHNNRVSVADARKEAIQLKKDYATKNDESNPLYWAYGKTDKKGSPQGQLGRFGRKARHLFFARDGIVDAIRKIQREGYVKLFRLIDEEVHKVVPNFPSLYNIVFKGAL